MINGRNLGAGTSRRLSCLSTLEGFYYLLAMDHGLTHGHRPNSVDYTKSNHLETCAPFVTGIVLCPGPARALELFPRTPLIVQCFGAPAGHTRVPVCTVEAAICMGATAVALQFNISDTHLSRHIEQIALFTSQAHSYAMPVLFMTGGYSTESSTEAADAIRISQELGADLIKVTLTERPEQSSVLTRALEAAPPVLLAGGPWPGELAVVMESARAVGFSGYCVGRNIFQAEEPSQVAETLSKMFGSG